MMLRLDFASFKYPPSPQVMEALRKELAHTNEYPDESYGELLEQLAKRYNRPKAAFILGNGLDEVIDLVTRAFVEKGDNVIIPSPTFSQFEEAAERVKAKTVFVNSMHDDGYAVKSKELLDKITRQTSLIWICSPNNPTGGITPIEKIIPILKNAPCPVVVDEALSDYSGKTVLDVQKDYNNLIVLKTFSKGYGLAGLRIGYAIAHPSIIEKMRNIKQIFNVNRFAVAAALAALSDQPYYDKLWKTFLMEKERHKKNLQALGVTIISSESNFFLLDFKTKERSKIIFQQLLEKGIRILPGWDPEFSGLDGRYCRVIVGKPEENDLFVKTLKDILGGLS